MLVDVLTGRSVVLLNMGRLAEGTEDARRALAIARDLGYLAGEGMALHHLAIAAWDTGDHDGAVELIGQLQLITGMPGTIARAGYEVITGVLTDAGDLAGADSAYAEALALCRDAGDLNNLPWFLIEMANLDVRAGRFQDAAAHLREGLQIVLRGGDFQPASGGLWNCALLCAATGRHADAATLWAAAAPTTGSRGSAARRRGGAQAGGGAKRDPAGARAGPGAGGRGARRGDEPGHRGRVRADAHRPRPAAAAAAAGRGWEGSAPGNGNWSPWSPRAAPTRRSPRSCTSASARSDRTWTGSGTRPAAAAAPT